MAEEFQESEVIFSDKYYDRENNCGLFWNTEMDRESRLLKKNKQKKLNNSPNTSSSVPVNIPSTVFGFSDYFDEEDDEEDELVPPHVLIRRRIQGKMAYSVCTGNGRTLKGRDLSQLLTADDGYELQKCIGNLSSTLQIMAKKQQLVS